MSARSFFLRQVSASSTDQGHLSEKAARFGLIRNLLVHSSIAEDDPSCPATLLERR